MDEIAMDDIAMDYIAMDDIAMDDNAKTMNGEAVTTHIKGPDDTLALVEPAGQLHGGPGGRGGRVPVVLLPLLAAPPLLEPGDLVVHVPIPEGVQGGGRHDDHALPGLHALHGLHGLHALHGLHVLGVLALLPQTSLLLRYLCSIKAYEASATFISFTRLAGLPRLVDKGITSWFRSSLSSDITDLVFIVFSMI